MKLTKRRTEENNCILSFLFLPVIVFAFEISQPLAFSRNKPANSVGLILAPLDRLTDTAISHHNVLQGLQGGCNNTLWQYYSLTRVYFRP
jgi:hypothetical protein